MVAPVDLDQLAEAFATVARLARPGQPLALGGPNAGLGEPLSDRLTAHAEVVKLDQLLVRQRGAEVRVQLTDDSFSRSVIS